MRYGVTLQGVYEPDEWIELVRWIESLGFDNLWITDSSTHAGDVYVYATLALQASSTLVVGTAVTNPLTRHPAITANAFRSLSQLAPGRVVCGIGVGDRPLYQLGLPMAKIATLRESIDVMRRLWSGESVEGEIGPWRLVGGHLLSPVPELPVYISASQPRALELTGEVADGLILLAGLFRRGSPSRGRTSPVAGGEARACRSTRPSSSTARSTATRNERSTRPARSPPGSRRRRPTTPVLPG